MECTWLQEGALGWGAGVVVVRVLHSCRPIQLSGILRHVDPVYAGFAVSGLPRNRREKTTSACSSNYLSGYLWTYVQNLGWNAMPIRSFRETVTVGFSCQSPETWLEARNPKPYDRQEAAEVTCDATSWRSTVDHKNPA